MNYALTELKEQHPWLRNYYGKMLQMVSKQIATARKTAKGKLSYRLSDKFNSFTYNQWGFRIEGTELWLSKIGRIKIVLHRQPVNIKQVTISRKNKCWYAVVTCDILRRRYSKINYSKPVGIDVGVTKFTHDSDSCVVDNPLFLTTMLKPLRRATRRVSRRQEASNNRAKARHMLARLYERINNKRRNFLHNLSTEYSRRNDLIFVERLRISNMMRARQLSRKIIDSGWYTFRLMLRYKANRVVEVDPYNTSVRCSECGNLVPKTLVIRMHECSGCGAVLDRDYNAALNILQKGLKLLQLPMQQGEVTPVEIPYGVAEAGNPHSGG